MPTLEWIGKDKVVNHHQQVPYRVLEAQYTYNAEQSDNMIIRGDNLEALKALLPKYEGKIKCIYIDPPYNTGNEGWVYNDNVNDPKIKKWLGEIVGSDDLTRHDKWLCMMYPRLRLLYKLLSDDGAIFISLDDNETYNAKLLCDEVFGANNFIANIIWENFYGRSNAAAISPAHNYTLIYSKCGQDWKNVRHLLPRTEGDNSKYKNPDNDPRGPWRSGPIFASGERHEGLMYTITTPSGRKVSPPKGSHWRMLETDYRKMESEGRIIYGEDGDNVPAIKLFLADVQEGMVPRSIWPHTEAGHTQDAKRELQALFPDEIPFDTPKPTRLIERIIKIAADPDSIILDAFAGSGTTAHAVLNLNKTDGGHRKFILIEMMDYAESITATRIKKAITGFTQDREYVLYDEEVTAKNLADGPAMLAEAKQVAKKAKSEYSTVKSPKIEDGHLKVIAIQKGKDFEPGTGGSFTFYDLGKPLLLPSGNLNENVSVDKIREYVYYMETKESMAGVSNGNPYFMGNSRDTAYYFYYEKDAITTLDHEFLATIPERSDSYIIYADLCTIPAEELAKYNITFKKIPRDIAKL